MKKLLIAALATLSINAFAQSYLIMDNGITITTDKSGFAYDFGIYAFPQKVTMKGGQYFVEENSVLATIDENGNLFRKYEVIPEKVIGKGLNYFLSDAGELYTIDSKGIVTLTVDENLKRAVNFGGNYFTVAHDQGSKMIDLYVVTKDGNYRKVELGESLKMKDVVAYGGSYFMTNRGLVYTVSTEGAVIPHPTTRVGIMQKRGGNYFTDSSGLFFTVAEDGTLIAPGLPISLKINSMSKLGSNYFLDLSGRLYTVDKDGNVFERMMRDHDFRNARIISL